MQLIIAANPELSSNTQAIRASAPVSTVRIGFLEERVMTLPLRRIGDIQWNRGYTTEVRMSGDNKSICGTRKKNMKRS